MKYKLLRNIVNVKYIVSIIIQKHLIYSYQFIRALHKLDVFIKPKLRKLSIHFDNIDFQATKLFCFLQRLAREDCFFLNSVLGRAIYVKLRNDCQLSIVHNKCWSQPVYTNITYWIWPLAFCIYARTQTYSDWIVLLE